MTTTSLHCSQRLSVFRPLLPANAKQSSSPSEIDTTATRKSVSFRAWMQPHFRHHDALVVNQARSGWRSNPVFRSFQIVRTSGEGMAGQGVALLDGPRHCGSPAASDSHP